MTIVSTIFPKKEAGMPALNFTHFVKETGLVRY